MSRLFLKPNENEDSNVNDFHCGDMSNVNFLQQIPDFVTDLDATLLPSPSDIPESQVQVDWNPLPPLSQPNKSDDHHQDQHQAFAANNASRSNVGRFEGLDPTVLGQEVGKSVRQVHPPNMPTVHAENNPATLMQRATTATFTTIAEHQGHASNLRGGPDPMDIDSVNLGPAPGSSVKHAEAGPSQIVPASVHTCQVCSAIFATKEIMSRHRAELHPHHKPFICILCNYMTTRRGNLFIHVNRMHDVQTFSCSGCTSRFQTEKGRDTHSQEKHVKGHPFVCEDCPLRYSLRISLSAHQKVQKHGRYKEVQQLEGPNQDEVELLNQPFAPSIQSEYFEEHSVPLLQQPENEQDQIRANNQNADNNVLPQELEEPVGQLQAPNTPTSHPEELNPAALMQKATTATFAEQLSHASNMQEGPNPMDVDSVNLELAPGCSVQYAETVPSQIVPASGYTCQVCCVTFSTKTSMLQHRAELHPQHKPFICIYCRHVANRRADLINHIKCMHEVQLFSCSGCASRFQTEMGRDTHSQEKHVKGHPFVCEDCPRRYSLHQNLYRHQKLRKHGRFKDVHQLQGPNQHENFIQMNIRNADKNVLRQELGESVGQVQPPNMPTAHAGGKLNSETLMQHATNATNATFTTIAEHQGHANNLRGGPNPMDTDSVNLGPAPGSSVKHAEAGPSQIVPASVHTCQVCCAIFATKEIMSRHRAELHPQHKPFICIYCHHVSNLRKSLISHIKIRHEVQLFSCSGCKQWFQTEVGRNLHFRQAHELNHFYLCEDCRKRFKSMNGLRGHQRNNLHRRYRIDVG